MKNLAYEVVNIKVLSLERGQWDRVMRLVIKPIAPIQEDLASFFHPGGGAVLKIGGCSRPYSFAEVESGRLVFYIKMVNQGEFSELLWLLQKGDTIQIEEFFRFFQIEKEENSYWFSTGVGVSPFLYALAVKYPFSRFFIGGRHPSSIPDILKLRELPRTSIYLSREKQSYSQGRYITEGITKDIISPEAKYYICGLSEMISDVSNKLVSLGASTSQIFVENFYSKMEN